MRCLLSALVALLFGSSMATAQDDFFEARVRPILVERCYACHGGVHAKGGLRLDSRQGWQRGGESGPALVPGDVEASLLLQAIRYESLEMPPSEAGGKLGDEEIETLTEWIRQGAQDPRDEAMKIGGMSINQAKDWWAFQPLPKLHQPLTSDRIDQLLEREIQSFGLTTAPLAEGRTLLRRAHYDLHGLPPSPEAVDSLEHLSIDSRWEELLESWFESPHYGPHWGRHWLDVVRYADTAGENTDRPLPHAWRYRNWVIDAIQRDMPFDQFVRMQIAGDLSEVGQDAPQREEGIVATGYLAIARRFGHDIDDDRHLTIEDEIDNLGKAFLGLTISCARCHDHKYDPITSRDYYSLYGILQSTRLSYPGCEPKGQPKDLVPLLSEAERDELLAPWRQRKAEQEREVQRRAELSSHPAMKEFAVGSQLLAVGQVDEGATVAIRSSEAKDTPIRVSVRKNEVLLLTILPNANYGADTTRIDLSVQQLDSEKILWSTRSLVEDFYDSNGRPLGDGAAWFFLESKDGLRVLNDHQRGIQGREELIRWSRGDNPAVFVNSSHEDISVWTKLQRTSLFVHPGPSEPVCVAWISPLDGNIEIEGWIEDAHPAGLDGVSYRLEKISNSDLGLALRQVSPAQWGPLLDPGPEPPLPVAYAAVDGEISNAKLHLRGDPHKLGEEVPRGWIQVFGGKELVNPKQSGRVELAQWIVENPLMARVMVNRIWQWHFGNGLVRTPNDFGSRGEMPIHGELLDELAAEFIRSGHSLRSMHRLLMNTKAYRRASEVAPSEIDRDPGNLYFARFSRRRLTAEEIRDSLLFASGELDDSMPQAHPFPPESTWTFTQHAPFYADYSHHRRSVYLMVQRQRRHPFLSLFDGADPNSSTSIRQTTTVPTQSLFFMNDPFFHEAAQRFAERLLFADRDETRLKLAYRLAYQRVPSDDEIRLGLDFIQNHPAEELERWIAYSRVLLASNEFMHVE